MATVVETQAYLNEAKTPTVIAPAAVKSAIKAWVPNGGKVGQQANLWARLLQDSELEEPDDALSGLYEEAFNIFSAMRRLTGEIELKQRQLIALYKGQFTPLDARMRVIAATLGYTV